MADSVHNVSIQSTGATTARLIIDGTDVSERCYGYTISHKPAERPHLLLELDREIKGIELNGVTVDANLSSVSTSELVRELSSREGVEATTAEPYQEAQVKVNGPAVVLVVSD